MDCPVCKYPNPQGATHCGMCYEVFNRSAAQAYLHAVHRERRRNDPETAPKTSLKIEQTQARIKVLMESVDWRRIAGRAAPLLKRSGPLLLAAAAFVGVWVLAGLLFSPVLWYHIIGRTCVFNFPTKTPLEYLISTTQDVKSWSERQGRLDTPLEAFKIDEVGNVFFESHKAPKGRRTAVLRAREWIQVLHAAEGDSSRTLPLNHPSLASVRVVLDKKGSLLERHYALSPRLAKSLPFLVPRFPKGRLRHGQTWTEPAEWIDIYNDWNIFWKGTFRWTAGEPEPCGNDACVRLTYQADLLPHLRGTPAWAKKAVRSAEARLSTEGVALFDAGHQRLVSNTFSYGGLLRIPITDLGRIPRELRIGRRVKGVKGEIVVRFENKIDLHKN